VASKYGEGTSHTAVDGHRDDDYNVYIYMTADYGETWKAIRNGIPNSGGSVHVVREHPRNPNLLFAGTEFGLWVSWDHGANWTALQMNVHTAPVADLPRQSRENDLVLATHGRSIWIFDDLTPIEKLNPDVLNSDLSVFDVRPATLWRLRQRPWSPGQKKFTGKNPPKGPLHTYHLKSAVPTDTTQGRS